jgi:hypothetical protein
MRTPWRWLRESDLVADLVGILRKAFPDPVPSSLVGDFKMPEGPTVSRVRTEARLRKDREAVDVVLLNSSRVHVTVRSNGVRDAVRAVRPEDVHAAIEVKLEPGLSQTGWSEDVKKLQRYPQIPTRVVLWLDTSLPLEAVGLTYRHQKGFNAGGRRADGGP